MRLRNQFRSLDDDEVDFLDSVLESTRAKEAEVKKQTSEQLDAFRRHQEEAGKAATQQDTSTVAETPETWTAGPRKRKKGREVTIGGVKLRRTSTAEKESKTLNSEGRDTLEGQDGSPTPEKQEADQAVKPLAGDSPETAATVKPAILQVSPPTASTPPATGLGLAAYSSDDDD